MHKLHSLKEKLCDELEMYESKSTFSAQDIERIEVLSDIVKNLGKIITMYEDEGYSNMGGHSYRSYGRGRGSQANRDSMGRYSGDNYSYGDVTEHLETMMREEPDEYKRRDIQNFIDKMRR